MGIVGTVLWIHKEEGKEDKRQPLETLKQSDSLILRLLNLIRAGFCMFQIFHFSIDSFVVYRSTDLWLNRNLKKQQTTNVVPLHKQFEKQYYKAWSDENKVSGSFMTHGKF